MPVRSSRSTAAPSAAAFVPESSSLRTLARAACDCRGCELYKDATQTVFGEGAAHAPLVLVGEAPGDVEDRTGRPFVGPAGKLLRTSLAQAGIDERDTYITNAVKHFKFIERGKRRIHQSPKRTEIVACSPWLEAEIRAIRPRLVLALGASAASAIFGPAFRLSQHRGERLTSPLAPHAMATVHPSSILRAFDDAARHDQTLAFVEDLRAAAAALDELKNVS